MGAKRAMTLEERYMAGARFLQKKFEQEGWASYREFTKGAKVPLVRDTVTRAFNESQISGLAIPTLIIIMVKLNMQPPEIAQFLRDYTDDEIFHTLLGDQPLAIGVYERAALAAVTKILKHKAALPVIAAQLELVGKAFGEDTEEYTSILRR